MLIGSRHKQFPGARSPATEQNLHVKTRILVKGALKLHNDHLM